MYYMCGAGLPLGRRKLSYYMDFVVIGSLLAAVSAACCPPPTQSRLRLRELPKGRSDPPRSAPLAAKRTTPCVVRAHCVEHYPSGGAGASTAKRSGASPRQTRFPDHMDISIPGSLLAAVSAACCPPQR